MNNTISPLGRYASIGALVASVAVLLSTLAVHVIVAITDTGHIDPFLDELAFAAFGVLVGAGSAQIIGVQLAADKINGLQTEVNAAHTRLDHVGAPAASNVEEQVAFKHTTG